MQPRSIGGFSLAASLDALVLSSQAAAGEARLSISSGKTKNVTCSAGVCAPTAANAVLNAGDLKTMLATGNVEVTTTGSGVQANNIQFDAPLAWSGASTLGLDAFESIVIAKPISVEGAGGLTLATNDGGSGGTLSFAKKGHVVFKNLASSLAINGTSYVLVGDLATLASDVTADAGGAYALAGNYDASGDGTYAHSPVTTPIEGHFEGLGNAISNLAIDDTTQDEMTGLFSEIYLGASIENLGLANVAIAANSVADVGALAGADGGTVFAVSVTGSVAAVNNNDHGLALIGGMVGELTGLQGGAIGNSYTATSVSVGSETEAGGLVGKNFDSATISNSHATGSVVSSSNNGASSLMGGLVGVNDQQGAISGSYATGSVTQTQGVGGIEGGLVGSNDATIENSYATGDASGGVDTTVGGLIGEDSTGAVSDSYSTGATSGGSGSTVGGSIGNNGTDGSSIADVYWDTTTSGTATGVGHGNTSGVTGLTTQQLQSGLPPGFQSSIWREKGKINGELPYLIANPPAR